MNAPFHGAIGGRTTGSRHSARAALCLASWLVLALPLESPEAADGGGGRSSDAGAIPVPPAVTGQGLSRPAGGVDAGGVPGFQPDGGVSAAALAPRRVRREPLGRPVDEARVERVRKGLGLRGCAAQLLLAYPQLNRTAPVEVGGLLFVGGTLRNVTRARERIVASGARAAVPLFAAADVEGGGANRLKSMTALRELPPARALAELSDEAVREWGRTAGRSMRAVGLNVNLAPVLDVAGSGHMVANQRSFSAEADVVVAKATAYARGLLAEGVVPIGKHFPGYGDLAGDSDHQLVRCDWPRERVEREAAAFTRAGSALGGVMLANVAYTAIDARPAVLSPAVVELAHRHGWLAVTDDLSIPLLADVVGGSPRDVLGGALLAGNDLLLTTAPPDWDKGVHPIGTLVGLAESDSLARRRVGEACLRVLRLKDRMGLLDGL